MDVLKQLGNIPLFKGLALEYLQSISRIIVEQEINRGKQIFAEGDEGKGFYVVISGRVKIFKLSPEGKEQTLHIFGPGEPFGEVPVFAGTPYPANAEALEKTKVFYFPRQAFVDLIQQNPTLALNMLGILSKRLHRFTALVEDLSLKEVPGRLAAYLLYLSSKQKDNNDLTLEITKTQLASLLGTIPETLSRILARMSREGIIKTDIHGHIQILDRKTLEKLAQGEVRLSDSNL
ncbi:MAG: Crp/Fnr family transcriptional regulator [Desulfobacterota bacterium]|nr:Crp/Fnr family transcriptional regulator [Thermodesulfobacteriota bacterium]